jgi:hypothetical protein
MTPRLPECSSFSNIQEECKDEFHMMSTDLQPEDFPSIEWAVDPILCHHLSLSDDRICDVHICQYRGRLVRSKSMSDLASLGKF